DAILDARGVRANASGGIGRTLHRSCFEAHLPRVQRTHHRRARDDAIAQRAAAMRAAVLDGREAVAQIEDRDLASADDRRAPFTRRDVFASRDADPEGLFLHVLSSAWPQARHRLTVVAG